MHANTNIDRHNTLLLQGISSREMSVVETCGGSGDGTINSKRKMVATSIIHANDSIVANARDEYSINTDVTANDHANKKVRKSRWSNTDLSATPVGSTMSTVSNVFATQSQESLQQSLILKMQLQQVTDKIQRVVQDALLIEQDPRRSPSPPPKYDSHGKRTNTREVRMRESLIIEKTKIIEELIKLNPSYQPPTDFVKVKPWRKVYIPVKEFPNYNFIGLIIGPRGNTQKKLEAESGCRISIRGKGASKEGSRGRANRNPDDDDELHVHLTGESDEQVDLAKKMIEDLLKPIDDEMNEHKQKQLRELALINGTLREDEYCPVCGEKGHKQFECPFRSKSFTSAGVKCSICGDLSHPTRDCPMKERAPKNEYVLDSEYDSFMAELDGRAISVGHSNAAGCINDAVDNSTIGGNIKVVENVASSRPKQTIIHVADIMSLPASFSARVIGTNQLRPPVDQSVLTPSQSMPALTPVQSHLSGAYNLHNPNNYPVMYSANYTMQQQYWGAPNQLQYGAAPAPMPPTPPPPPPTPPPPPNM